MSRFILMDGRQIPVTYEPNIMRPQGRLLEESGLLTKWATGLDKRFFLHGILVQSVDLFGSRVGFVKISAHITGRNADGTPDGQRIPGIVFLRGDSVGILVVLECPAEIDPASIEMPRETYAVLTVQPRAPTRAFDVTEIPAGMLDGSGDFTGIAAKELAEELGDDFAISEKDLVPLGGPIFLSPGGCDERLQLFCCTRTMDRARAMALKGRLTGALAEGERITLTVVPLDTLAEIPDAKTQLAYLKYRHQLR